MFNVPSLIFDFLPCRSFHNFFSFSVLSDISLAFTLEVDFRISDVPRDFLHAMFGFKSS